MPIFKTRLQFERFFRSPQGLHFWRDAVGIEPCLDGPIVKLSENLLIFRGLLIRIVCRTAKREKSGEQTSKKEKTVPLRNSMNKEL